MTQSVIITCAVTGGIHTPTMSEHLPITPDEITADAVAAAQAGASILHLHARDPRDGRPTPDPEVFMQFLPRIKQQCDAVVNITTGGGLGMTLEERLAAALRARPEMASLNMGSMNFGLYPMLQKYKEWRYDWEPQFLEKTRDFIFKNTFMDIERVLRTLGEKHGTLATSIRWHISWIAAWCVPRYLYRQSLGSSAASAQIRKIWPICAGSPYGCSVRIMNGLFLRPDGTRCPSAPRQRSWAVMCAWAWKTAFG
jgi:uncharacterized protein (DUF849 family)